MPAVEVGVTQRLWIPIAVLAVIAASGSAPAGPLLWQTSSEGDDIHAPPMVDSPSSRRWAMPRG